MATQTSLLSLGEAHSNMAAVLESKRQIQRRSEGNLCDCCVDSEECRLSDNGWIGQERSRNPPPLLPRIPKPDLRSLDRLKDAFSGQRQQKPLGFTPRYSEQDSKTRNARASIASAKRGHKSTASYPIYSPTSFNTGFSNSTPLFSHERSQSMESPPRLYARSKPSSGGSIHSRSTFESRIKSPLSITSSSLDYESSRTSIESTFPDASHNNGLYVSKTRIMPTVLPPPMYVKAAVGRDGKQHAQVMRPPPRPLETGSYGMRYTRRTPGEGFKKLPEEILLVIITELRNLHHETGSLSCSTCWMRDAINIGLSCKKWWNAASIALYEDIRLVGQDSILHTKKKLKIKYGTRLLLLRRTLRGRLDLADHVKSLKVPAMPDAAKSKKEQDAYLDLVASLVMACPNLERLHGFYATYNHEFTRFDHSLSSRSKLAEKAWIINPSPFQRQHRYHLSADAEHLTPDLTPSQLMPEQCITFLTNHSNWSHLRTLFVHCNPGGNLDSSLFIDVVHTLPALDNLHVSNFSAASFNDTTLLSLPSLRKLRLENLPGITSTGLTNYASPYRTDNLTSLSLLSIPLLSLPVLTRLISHAKSLTHFTISQAPSPSLPIGIDIFLHPYLASPTLQYLHWEFTNPDDNQATQILAKSITFNGFPSLRTIRAPTDHDGLLQNLCKPIERIELPGDKYRNLGAPGQTTFTPSGYPQTQSLPSLSPTRSTFSGYSHSHSNSISSNFIKSPTRSAFSLSVDQLSVYSSEDSTASIERSMNLVTARRMAQQRIDAALTQPKFHIIIWDPNGNFHERFAVCGFLGDISSKITYTLRPDVEGMDESIVTVDGPGGLLDKSEEVHLRDGCTGSWNLEAGAKAKGASKGKERWWHTERGRWKEVPLEGFF